MAKLITEPFKQGMGSWIKRNDWLMLTTNIAADKFGLMLSVSCRKA